MARDPTTGYLWAVLLSGWIYRINISTGTIVQDAFGSDEFSRIRLSATNNLNSVEDITFDASGNMYVVTNSSGNSSPARIYAVDKTGSNPGLATLVSSITVNGSNEDEFEGLSFGPDGVLYATTGYGTMTASNRSKMWQVDIASGVATKLFDLPTTPSPVDYESISCTQAEADLSILKTNTPGVNNDFDQANDTLTSGATTIYRIVARNDGPAIANNTVLRDPTPTNLTCTTATCSAAGSASCPAATGAALVSGLQSSNGVMIPSFPPGGTITIDMTCTVN